MGYVLSKSFGICTMKSLSMAPSKTSLCSKKNLWCSPGFGESGRVFPQPAEGWIAKEFPKMKVKIKTCPNMFLAEINTGKET